MEFREVEKKIKACLGDPEFIGKVAVRIINGEIVACDVGKVGTGMPPVTSAELMKRAIKNNDGPHWRDFLTEEERRELDTAHELVEQVRQLIEERDKAYAEAEREATAVMRREGAAAEHAIYGGDKAMLAREKVDRARAAVDSARRAWLEARDMEGDARVERSKIEQRIYHRTRRRMQPEKDQAAATPPARTIGQRLKDAIGAS